MHIAGSSKYITDFFGHTSLASQKWELSSYFLFHTRRHLPDILERGHMYYMNAMQDEIREHDSHSNSCVPTQANMVSYTTQDIPR